MAIWWLHGGEVKVPAPESEALRRLLMKQENQVVIPQGSSLAHETSSARAPVPENENGIQLTTQTAEFLKLWHTLFLLDVEHLLRNPREIEGVDISKYTDSIHCKIGKWMDSQTDAIRSLDEFKALDIAHRQFHLNVAVLIECHANEIDARHGDFGESLEVSNQRMTTSLDLFIEKLRKIGALMGSEGTSLRLWDPSFEIGVPQIDRQHRTIMTLIELAVPNPASTCVGLSPETIVKKLFRLIRSEVEIEIPVIDRMIEEGLPSAQDHKDAHSGLLKFIDYAETSGMTTADVSAYLGRWYVEHLVLYDADLREFCAKNTY
jgi:hemerythrin